MFLSICTPTYNRVYTLERVYRSLLHQTVQDFEWIIIDDGSSDGTKKLVEEWISENRLKIRYFYQENQGKHIALNKGVSLCQGKLFTCLDSDDWFYKDAIEKVMKRWSEIKNKEKVAGIIGLDTYSSGKIVGTKLPENEEKVNWIDLVYQHKVKGDKAYFFVLNIIKKYDFPNYKNNKHFPPSYQLYMLSKKYNMLLLNEPLKYVEYLDDGISNNLWRKYLIAPDNYAKYRIDIMNLIPTRKRKIINTIHLNSSLLFAENKHKITGFNNKILVFITKPLGILLYFYLNLKKKWRGYNER